MSDSQRTSQKLMTSTVSAIRIKFKLTSRSEHKPKVDIYRVLFMCVFSTKPTGSTSGFSGAA
jgi:hypothetical protein